MRIRPTVLLLLAALGIPALAGPAAAQNGFRSPDDSIHCLWGERLTCEVGWSTERRRYKPRDCEPMSSLWFTLGPTGRTDFVCNMGDSVRTEGALVLAAGAERRRGGVTCAMRRDGMRCTNRSGRGFRLHRGREELF